MAHLTSRRLWQLLYKHSAVANTHIISVPKRNVITAHSVPLINSGHDLERPDVLFGTQLWRWVRPATPVESLLDDWNRHHTRFGFAFLTINAEREIPEDMWRQAVIHLRNQVPVLRMAILPHNNEKWICDLKDMDISIEMYENVAPLDAVDMIINEGMDKAPWVCKVIKANPDDPCLCPEEIETKPYQYYFCIMGHHGLIDGTSNALITIFVMGILNALMAGKPIDDRIQLSQAIKGEEIIAKTAKLKEALRNNPDWFQKEKERLLSTFKTPLLNKAFPAPNVSNPKTAMIIRTADALTLSAFRKQCKSAGVSETNGLTAIMNTAIVEMVREAGILQDSYHLTLNTIVDLRRYMKIHQMTATGMFISSVHQSMHPTKNVREEFWQHARIIQEDATTLLKTDGSYIESIVREMLALNVDTDAIFNSSNTTVYQRDFTLNNMKDVTAGAYDPKRHKHAVITDVFTIQTIQHFNPMMFTITTFRGTTQFTLSYSTDFISQETADKLMERIVLLIRNKSQL